MAKRTRNYKSIEESGFALDDSLRAWCAEKYPAIDPDATYEVFKDKALAGAWIYASWPAAFRNYLRRSKEFAGVVYKRGLDDPKWSELMTEARAIGFRDPNVRLESPDQYRQALRQFKPPTQRGLDVGGILKRIPK